jgi:hypothetical protein
MPGELTLAPGPDVALAWLKASSRLLTLLGDDASRVSGRLIPPYPRCLMQTLPSPAPRAQNHINYQDLALSGVGAPDGGPAGDELWRIAATALEELAQLPAQPVTDPTLPVCTMVEILTRPSFVPDRGGHPRYTGTARLTLHRGPNSVP